MHFLKNLHLLPIAVVVPLLLEICHSQLPKVLECSQRDLDIVVFNSSFWFECEKGQQVLKHCVTFVNQRTSRCIPIKHVVENLHMYKNTPIWTLFRSTFADEALTIPHCMKLLENFAKIVTDFPEKQYCLKDYETVNRSNVAMNPCTIKNRNVFFLHGNAWFHCEDDGFALLKGCAFKFPDYNQYWCMDFNRIIDLLWYSVYYSEIDKRLESRNSTYFCEDLEKFMEHIHPDYKKELTSCNDKSVKYGQAPICIETQIKTETETETQTQVKEPVIVDPEPEGEDGKFKVVPYPGGNEGKKMVENCQEDPIFNADFNCYYKCSMPYMCRVTSGYCLSFYVLEYMFRTYHNENNKNFSRPYGAWNDAKFNRIVEGLGGAEQAIYKKLEQRKGRSNYHLFQKLAQVHQLLLGEEEAAEEPDPPQVTIKVGRVATSVEFPSIPIYIVEALAPFYDDFIEKYTESCPEVVADYEYYENY